MPSYQSIFKAAAVQAEPVWLDADATISKSIHVVEEAARAGAAFIAFPEVFIPGYMARRPEMGNAVHRSAPRECA
jgi:nitrilase